MVALTGIDYTFVLDDNLNVEGREGNGARPNCGVAAQAEAIPIEELM